MINTNIKEPIIMVINMVMVKLFIKMEINLWGNLVKINMKDLVFLFTLMEEKYNVK